MIVIIHNSMVVIQYNKIQRIFLPKRPIILSQYIATIFAQTTPITLVASPSAISASTSF